VTVQENKQTCFIHFTGRGNSKKARRWNSRWAYISATLSSSYMAVGSGSTTLPAEEKSSMSEVHWDKIQLEGGYLLRYRLSMYRK
jgi:hypothetical protein